MYTNSSIQLSPTLTKTNRVYSKVTYNKHNKFELNRKHRLGAIVFTHIHTLSHIHTSLKHINMSNSHSRIFSRLQYFSCIVHVPKVKKLQIGQRID